jgi:DNA-binding transcriptional LysR family regulator
MGKVTSPQDLQDKDWIHNRKLNPLLEWMHEGTDEVHAFSLSDPKVTVSNTATAQLCAQQGGGLCVLPSYQIQEDLRLGRLEIVLPDWTLPSGGIHIVYPNMSFRPARTKIFVQELIRQQKLLA